MGVGQRYLSGHADDIPALHKTSSPSPPPHIPAGSHRWPATSPPARSTLPPGETEDDEKIWVCVMLSPVINGLCPWLKAPDRSGEKIILNQLFARQDLSSVAGSTAGIPWHG